jgi:beta-lactam-binding protein with PASTA domain
MNIFRSGLNALGRLLIVAALAVTFFLGLVGVVYMSLQGHVIQVPDITGKTYAESEKALSDLGLKIQRRADRVSNEPPNTILEQLPHPGETVKTGQLIFVVASKQGPAGEQTPNTLKKTGEEDDTEKIEEMISDKPKKKSNSNSNTNKKKPDTTRDVIGNISDSNISPTGTDNSNKKETAPNNNGEKENKNPSTQEKLPANRVILIKPTGPDPRPKTPGKPNK